MTSVKRCKVLVIGSGGNGISCAILLDQAGVPDVTIITKHPDFGGTWLQNRYPGCEIDVPALTYQFSYAFRCDWDHVYASGDEIASYMQGVARAHGLYEKTDFNTEMLDAEWQAAQNCWRVVTDRGIYLADFVIAAAGALENAAIPDLPGLDGFEGPAFHSSMWPQDYSAAGQRVAVIGAGSSSLQIVPALQPIARQVYNFQRTPNYILPKFQRAFSQEELDRFASDPEARFQERLGMDEVYDKMWSTLYLGKYPEELADFGKRAVDYLEAKVTDPVLKAKLTPTFDFACKRIGSSDDFYDALLHDNVEVIAEGVVGFERNSVISASGRETEVDAVVFATGFNWNGAIFQRIKRRDGVTIADFQRDYPRAYKSVSVAGAPNLFFVMGPNGQAPNGLTPGELVPPYVVEVMRHMEQHGIAAMEVTDEAEVAWKEWADGILANGATVAGGCYSYYQDAHGRNKAAWPSTTAEMVKQLGQFDASVYRDVSARG